MIYVALAAVVCTAAADMSMSAALVLAGVGLAVAPILKKKRKS